MDMKYYEALARVTVGQNSTLHLTDAQAQRRGFGLTAVPGRPGFYKAKAPLDFKGGEIFGADPAPGPAGHVRLLEMGAAEMDARNREALEARAAWKARELEARRRREAASAGATRRKEPALAPAAAPKPAPDLLAQETAAAPAGAASGGRGGLRKLLGKKG